MPAVCCFMGKNGRRCNTPAQQRCRVRVELEFGSVIDVRVACNCHIHRCSFRVKLVVRIQLPTRSVQLSHEQQGFSRAGRRAPKSCVHRCIYGVNNTDTWEEPYSNGHQYIHLLIGPSHRQTYLSMPKGKGMLSKTCAIRVCSSHIQAETDKELRREAGFCCRHSNGMENSRAYSVLW